MVANWDRHHRLGVLTVTSACCKESLRVCNEFAEVNCPCAKKVVLLLPEIVVPDLNAHDLRHKVDTQEEDLIPPRRWSVDARTAADKSRRIADSNGHVRIRVSAHV